MKILRLALWLFSFQSWAAPLDAIFPHQFFLGTAIGLPYLHRNTFLQQHLDKSSSQYLQPYLDLYGWVNPSYNVNAARDSNLPLAFSYLPKQLELNQLSLNLEKLPDTLQQTQLDYGFNLSNYYGIDYRFTTMQGGFSQQYLQNNLLYGDDPLLFNVQVFVPGVGQGSLITLGRYYAPGDIEFPYSPQNYLISHSLSYCYSSFTQMGATVTTKLNDQWSYLLGIHAGSDIAVWSNSARPSLVAFLQWIQDDQQNSLWLGINSINNGRYGNNWNNLQQFNLIWTHRFNDGFFIETSSYIEYQFDANQGGPCIYPSGYGCGPLIPGISWSYSLLTYIEKKLTDRDYSSLRAELFDDFQGQRSGYATAYLEFTLGITHVINDMIKFRSEIRVDTALQAFPYDNGSRKSLVTGLFDCIVLL